MSCRDIRMNSVKPAGVYSPALPFRYAGRRADGVAGADAYGIAVFGVHPDPGDFGGRASITVTQYHAVGADPVNPATGAKGAPTPDYTEFETFTLIRPRRG